jgi:hypothetical protein
MVAAGYRRRGVEATRRSGKVSPAPTSEGAVAVGLDAEGRPGALAPVALDGSFELVSATPLDRAYVAVSGSRAGDVVRLPGGAAELALPLSPLGKLAVRVVDHDSGRALPSRIVVHGRDGTREPNMGPPHRATGAGPLVDAEEGLADMLLPQGKYRVLATRGPEYTVDARDVEVGPGQGASAELRLRHVIDTPGWAGSDLHVHSRGSFDSAVSLEDRVRSLLAAGIDFAVPSEHNRIGSYGSVMVAGQGAWLSWVPAVEVTTVNPLRGHFNVFPYEAAKAPRNVHTGLSDLLYFVRKESPGSLVQINHPRMGRIGHFTMVHLETETARGLARLATGFDTIEVYNGFDLGEPAKTEAVVAEWIQLLEKGRRHWATGNSDSHGVQYITVGYPRTYVAITDDHEGGLGPPLDVPGLVASLRKGHAFATSGPFVEVSQEQRGPGEALKVTEGRARVRVRVRAAPWLDASEIDVVVGGKSALKRSIASPPPRVGLPEGTLDEARRAAVRFDEELDVAVPAGARSLVVLVRGERRVGEVLPFMDFKPFAVVNPLLVE